MHELSTQQQRHIMPLGLRDATLQQRQDARSRNALRRRRHCPLHALSLHELRLRVRQARA
jgi:hypothetical protein